MPGELQLRGANIARFIGVKTGNIKLLQTGKGGFLRGYPRSGWRRFFRVADRKKDMFISGGKTFIPRVEAQLIECDDLVEFSVVGVPDDKWGEVGCVFYVPQAGPYR